MIDKTEVGKRIRAIRLSLGYTQSEFMKVLTDEPRTPRSISRWENGHSLPGPKVLNDIAFYGQISVDELLHGKENIMAEFVEWVEVQRDYDIAENPYSSGEPYTFSIEMVDVFLSEKNKERANE